MEPLNPNTESKTLEGCDRLWVAPDGQDVLVQLRPASADDHAAIAPRFVPHGEVLGRVSRAALLEAARNLLANDLG